ncbi:hypothetical protein WICPIJ_008832 [Wickerhamomyces pijperi]|uniref:Uncharacterized protein n=1 Tax=Wickerhamomyces pijperi TaxID=599730 RepID=A0A9P8PWH3_WICPI|nr:hypothetical protein WICPIJ_008832 [Wickerhamomyces pijperi]
MADLSSFFWACSRYCSCDLLLGLNVSTLPKLLVYLCFGFTTVGADVAPCVVEAVVADVFGVETLEDAEDGAETELKPELPPFIFGLG